MKRVLFSSVLLLLLVVSCKKESVAPLRSVAVQDQSGNVAFKAEQAQAPSSPADAAPAPLLPRMVIRNATLQLIVTDVPSVSRTIARLAAERGGYLGNSREWRDADHVRGSLSARVPSAQLDAFLASVRGLAVRVESEEISGSDVSQEYVDLASRLRNLEATEEELRALLTTIRQRTQKASEVLSVHEEMVKVRGEIEQVKGRMSYLDQMTAFSTVQMELIPDALIQPIAQPGWQPLAIIRAATRSLVSALQNVATLVIWLVIYVLPLILIVALFFTPFVLWLRRKATGQRAAA